MDHAMTCNTLRGAATLSHEFEVLKENLYLFTLCSGTASSVEPKLCSHPGAHAAATIADRLESHGDILLVLPDGLTAVDVLVLHPAVWLEGGLQRCQKKRSGRN